MWSRIKQGHKESATLIVALPLLFSLTVAAELIQHVIEYRAGMYASLAAMEATGDDPARMAFGQVKILVLALLPFWVSRWHLLRGQAGRRVLGDRRSVRLYVPVILLGMVIALLMHFGGRLLSPFVADGGLLMAIGFAFFLATMALEIYLSVWKVGAALGNPRMTIPASFRLVHGNFWWSLGFYLAMFVPLIVAHYLLAVLPLGRPDGILWAVLVLDSLLVGYLGLVLATTQVLIARRATERNGLALVEASQDAGERAAVDEQALAGNVAGLS